MFKPSLTFAKRKCQTSSERSSGRSLCSLCSTALTKTRGAKQRRRARVYKQRLANQQQDRTRRGSTTDGEHGEQDPEQEGAESRKAAAAAHCRCRLIAMVLRAAAPSTRSTMVISLPPFQVRVSLLVVAMLVILWSICCRHRTEYRDARPWRRVVALRDESTRRIHGCLQRLEQC